MFTFLPTRSMFLGAIDKHRHYWSIPSYRQSIFFGLLFLSLSVIFNHYSTLYATLRADNTVSDLLLDNLPIMNVDFIVNEGAVMFIAYLAILLLWEPRKIPFVLKSVAFFVFTRAVFITFTHLGTIPNHSYLDPTEIFKALSIGGDYFFSGHTGMPFLVGLIFWHDFHARVTFFVISGIFAVSVILGHLHYSIDVFAAFFITHSIYVLAKRFFTNDYILFNTKDADKIHKPVAL